MSEAYGQEIVNVMPQPRERVSRRNQNRSPVARVNGRLLRGMSEADQAEFVERIKNCKQFRDVVNGVLTEQIDLAIIKAEDPVLLKSPNYLAEHAHLAGYRRGLRAAIELLTLKDDDQ